MFLKLPLGNVRVVFLNGNKFKNSFIGVFYSNLETRDLLAPLAERMLYCFELLTENGSRVFIFVQTLSVYSRPVQLHP